MPVGTVGCPKVRHNCLRIEPVGPTRPWRSTQYVRFICLPYSRRQVFYGWEFRHPKTDLLARVCDSACRVEPFRCWLTGGAGPVKEDQEDLEDHWGASGR